MNPSLGVNQYAHTSWKISQGFTKGVIFSIAQTPDGYLWLGTEFGLLRFDGIRNVQWEPPAGERLPSNDVRKLCVAHDGRLWIGTYGGLASWKDGRLTQYPELNGKFVESLLEDRHGTVWVGTWAPPAGRLCAIESGGTHCYGEDGGFGSAVTALYEDRGGNLWAGALSGLWRWNPGPPKLYPMPNPEQRINALIEHGGGLLIAKDSGTIRLKDGRAEAYPLSDGLVFESLRLLRDRNGGLWVGAALNQGILHVHEGRTDSYTRSDGLSGNAVLSLLEDREGNIWVSTTDGLDRFREFAVHTMSAQQGFTSRGVESILAARDGSIWLGTDDGLQRWKRGQMTIYRKRIQRAPGADKHNGVVPGPTPPITEITASELPDDRVNSLFENDRGEIWVATLRGMAVFESGRIVPISSVPEGIVYSIAAGSGGSVWISHEAGLFRLLGANVVERIPLAKLGRKGVATALVRDSLQDGLWVGFSDNGVAFLKQGEIHATYTAANGLGAGRVNALKFGGDGTLWVSTEGGLSRLHKQSLTTLTSRNALPCDATKWVIEDDAHSFWLSMPCGLVRIGRPELDAWTASPKRTVQATVFDNSDGFLSHSFTSGYSPPVAKGPDGKLWFNTFGQVSVVDPRHLPFNNLPPPVHIEQIFADRQKYDVAPGLRLPALTRDLAFDFVALSLVAPEKNRYRFRLEGWDSDWREAVNELRLEYNNLPPRHYRLRVIACNNSGVWNETGDTLEFSIAPAYYQTSWFRALCAAAFVAMMWGLYRLRVYQIAREFAAQTAERTRIARELHDTLLQSFQAALIQMQAARNVLERRPEKAAQNLDRAITTAAGAVAEGRSAIQNLRAEPASKGDLAELLTDAGQEMARSEEAPVNPPVFSVMVEGERQDLDPVLQDEIYRIGRELLRNAVRHAQAGRIEAEIRYESRQFRLHIRDDGKGIDPEILKTGARSGHWGLPGMRERANRFGGKLEFWSEAGAGTEAVLSVPAAVAYGASNSARFSFLRRRRQAHEHRN